MRTSPAAALLLLAACATLPPLRAADPAQAVATEPSTATAAAGGVRIFVRPGQWDGSGDVEDYLTPVEVAIQNGSGRRLAVRPGSFSLLAPGGFRYEALSTSDVRRAFGPFRGSGYGYTFFSAYPWGGPPYPWGPPWFGWWGWGYGPSRWWGPVPYSSYGDPVPPRALAQGTLDAGGRASVLVFFPVPASSLTSLELNVNLADAEGQRVAELRVPFVREGHRPPMAPLPPTAAPPAAGQPASPSTPAAPAPSGAPPWVDEPVGRPPEAPGPAPATPR
jgi:hypothetical protein